MSEQGLGDIGALGPLDAVRVFLAHRLQRSHQSQCLWTTCYHLFNFGRPDKGLIP